MCASEAAGADESELSKLEREFCETDTVIKLKNSDNITRHAVGHGYYWLTEYVTVGPTPKTFDVCINVKVDGAYANATKDEHEKRNQEKALKVITEQCSTINVKGHSVKRDGNHRSKNFELFCGVLNELVPPYDVEPEDLVDRIPIDDMTEKDMLKEILMHQRNRVVGLTKQPKLFFVITKPGENRPTQSQFAQMIQATDRAHKKAKKITGYTDALIDLIPIDPLSSLALKKGISALAKWGSGTKLYRIGGSPSAPPPLPERWAEDVDPSSGNKYFYNEATGETTWERPFGRGVESMRR